MLPVCGVLRVEFADFPSILLSQSPLLTGVDADDRNLQVDMFQCHWRAYLWLNPNRDTSSSLIFHSYVPDIC